VGTVPSLERVEVIDWWDVQLQAQSVQRAADCGVEICFAIKLKAASIENTPEILFFVSGVDKSIY
jgi:hypothetical protein